MSNGATLLSVNVNKIALLRNSRGNDYPNVLAMAQRAVRAGAHGITVHPRPDERHATYNDVRELAVWLKTEPALELNVEGYPCPAFMDMVLDTRPDQCTLVPDDPHQLTSDHGWDIPKHAEQLRSHMVVLRDAGIRSSLFVDPEPSLMKEAQMVGADRVELYTESCARSYEMSNNNDAHQRTLDAYVRTAVAAVDAGLGINAGHDLNLTNVGMLLQACRAHGAPIDEVSIGHAIMVETFDYGFESTIKRYKELMNTGAERITG